MTGVILFGGTGSIGTQVLDIIRKQDFTLLGFTYNSNLEKAIEIIKEFQPEVVGITKIDHADKIKKIDGNINIIYDNPSKILEYSYSKKTNKIIYINAVSGSAGLLPTYEILNHNHDCLLANKESLVMAGKIIMDFASSKHLQIIPIDSEHSGLLKIILGKDKSQIENLIITASGGALRDYDLSKFKDVKKEDALRHPNWEMGQDITINCATMMNKGYEVIEACHLFNMDIDHVKVLVHKESVVHALVEYKDGTIEANMGTADMRNPISFAMNYPFFKSNDLKKLNLSEVGTLNFKELDLKRYPIFKLAIDAFKKGGYYPTILNAANEASVKLFLEDKIGYLDIYDYVNRLLYNHDNYEITKQPMTIENILKLDRLVKNDVYNLEKGCEQ